MVTSLLKSEFSVSLYITMCAVIFWCYLEFHKAVYIILGPLLFLIFVNDIPDSLSSADLLLFADHTKCFHKINHSFDCDSLQCDLNNLSTWRNLWNLHFNLDKCIVMRYTCNPTPILQDYLFNNHHLICKNSHRDLGLIMSKSLC